MSVRRDKRSRVIDIPLFRAIWSIASTNTPCPAVGSQMCAPSIHASKTSHLLISHSAHFSGVNTCPICFFISLEDTNYRCFSQENIAYGL